MDVTKGVKRHRFVYQFLRIIAGWVLRIITGFSYDKCRIESRTFLCLANHTMDMDPLLMVIGTHRHMRFVASANIMRGFSGSIIKFLVDPIPRHKGASADDTVELIKQNLQSGVSVGMFPEGNRTWNGESGFISLRTAKLAKESGAALVTYRITGGYMRTPRWGTKARFGKTHGALVNEYTPEMLSAMTVEQVYEAINRDLYVNAYEEQKKNPVRYRSKAPAECIESVLYCCPKCGALSSIDSKGDRFACRCGLEGTVDEYGFLHGKDLPYDNVLDWDRAQKAYILKNAEKFRADEEPLSLDPQATVIIKENGESRTVAENAAVFLYGDRIRIRDIAGTDESFPLADISKLSAFRNTRVFFTCGRRYVELHFARPVSGLKYYALWRVLTGKEYV